MLIQRLQSASVTLPFYKTTQAKVTLIAAGALLVISSIYLLRSWNSGNRQVETLESVLKSPNFNPHHTIGGKELIDLAIAERNMDSITQIIMSERWTPKQAQAVDVLDDVASLLGGMQSADVLKIANRLSLYGAIPTAKFMDIIYETDSFLLAYHFASTKHPLETWFDRAKRENKDNVIRGLLHGASECDVPTDYKERFNKLCSEKAQKIQQYHAAVQAKDLPLIEELAAEAPFVTDPIEYFELNDGDLSLLDRALKTGDLETIRLVLQLGYVRVHPYVYGRQIKGLLETGKIDIALVFAHYSPGMSIMSRCFTNGAWKQLDKQYLRSFIDGLNWPLTRELLDNVVYHKDIEVVKSVVEKRLVTVSKLRDLDWVMVVLNDIEIVEFLLKEFPELKEDFSTCMFDLVREVDGSFACIEHLKLLKPSLQDLEVEGVSMLGELSKVEELLKKMKRESKNLFDNLPEETTAPNRGKGEDIKLLLGRSLQNLKAEDFSILEKIPKLRELIGGNKNPIHNVFIQLICFICEHFGEDVGINLLNFSLQYPKEEDLSVLKKFPKLQKPLEERKKLVDDFVKALEKTNTKKIEEIFKKNPEILLFYASCGQKVWRYALSKDEVVVKRLFVNEKVINDVDEEGFSPLSYAIQQKVPTAVIQHLLDKGARIDLVDKKGYTVAHIAAGFNASLSTLKLLKVYGVNFNITSKSGTTPLLLACLRNSEDVKKVLNFLKDNGADIDADGYSAVYFAVARGNLNALQWLHENGVDINRKDKQGRSPLRLVFDNDRKADSNANCSIIKYLIQNGANVNEINSEGEHLFNYGMKNSKRSECDALLSSGVSLKGIQQMNLILPSVDWFLMAQKLPKLFKFLVENKHFHQSNSGRVVKAANRYHPDLVEKITETKRKVA